MLVLLLTAALALPPPAAPPPAPPEEAEVSELLIIARRTAPDPSDVSTECLWRELPPLEREALTRESELLFSSRLQGAPRPVRRRTVTDSGVALALHACGAPSDEGALPFARVAVNFYGLERAAGAALVARGFAPARLAGAWDGLPASDRESLAAQAGRSASGARMSESQGERLAVIVLGLIGRLRPLNVLNPFAYKRGGLNHQIVAFYAPRAVRYAMEKRF